MTIVQDTLISGPALLPVYAQMPVTPVRGHGSWLVDEQGNEWLDAYGGHAVASTGHSHPDVVKAIADQAAKLLFYSAAVPLPLREQLAERIASLCPDPLAKVFFCNSGAEANENAHRAGAEAHRPPEPGVDPRRLARPHAGRAVVHRRRALRGRGPPRRGAALDQGGSSTTSRDSRRWWIARWPR